MWPIGCAFVVRLTFAIALHVSGAWAITPRGALTPDEATTDAAAHILARDADLVGAELLGSAYTGWLSIVTIVYRYVWDSLLATKLLNVALGTLLVLAVSALASRVGGRRERLSAAWATALFPPLIVWSGLGLREPLVGVLFVASILAGVELVDPRPRTRWLIAGWILLFCVATTGLIHTRAYVAFLSIAMVGLASLAVAGSKHCRRPVVHVTIAIVAVVGGLAVSPTGRGIVLATTNMVSQPAASTLNPFAEEPSDASPTGQAPSPVGDERFAQDPDSPEPSGSATAPIRSSTQSIRARGVVRATLIALLAGRPVWRTAEFYFLLQPGVVLWWAMLPWVVLGGGVLLVHRHYGAFVLVAGTSLVVVATLAVTGLFIRHHAMAEPIAIVLASLGWAQWRNRSSAVRRLVAGASAAMLLAAVVSVIASL
jgi:hypothetical protein